MSELIDPEMIGRARLAREVKAGWHVQGLLALHDAYVGPDFVLIDVRASNGHPEPLRFRLGEYAPTRTPAEQVQYTEARHRLLLAESGLEKRTVSGQPVMPCMRPECCSARAELAELRRRRKAMQISAPVPTAVLVSHPGRAR